jgi:hypothetical protein
MTIYFGQIYIQVGISFPFSHLFQKSLGESVTKFVKPSSKFINL